MTSKMVVNIEEFVDFDALRVSNNKGFKWSKKFGIHATRYIRFVLELKNNPDKYLSLLKDESEQQELREDYKTMFYAAEVENFLVAQFYNAIISVLKRLGVNKHAYEEFISHGLLAIRSSVWMYRFSTTKFSSFAYSGIYNRILGLLSKKSVKQKAKRQVGLINLSDLHGNECKNKNWYEEASVSNNQSLEFDELPLSLEDIIKSANLSDQDTMLLEYFMMKSNGVVAWNKMYREEVLKRTGKKLSKQAVVFRLRNLQDRLVSAIKLLKGEEFVVSFAMSA